MGSKAFVWLLASVAAAAMAATSRAQQIDTSYYAGMRWRLIGPYRSGNVYAVAGIPGNPYVYYAGMPEGGVWKTSDAGNTWQPIFDEVHVPTIGAVVVAPSDPNIVYVGTGDPAGWGFTPGNGVYKSTDAGKTWRHIGLEGTHFITNMVVDPHDPNIVLVGALGVGSHELGGTFNTTRGVFRSTNGGQTWTRVLYKDPYTGVFALTYDYTNPHLIYAALLRNTVGLTAAQRDSLKPIGAGIYKSIDEGATWTAVAGRGLPESARGFAIALASGTEGRRVYAEPESMGREAHGLYRSDDGGATWTLGTPNTASATGPIYADPKNPDVVYLMGTSVYRSDDGGHHFASVKGSAGGDDPRDLWIDPTNPRRMLLGVDQGPTITVNGGETWTPWYDLPNGQFYRVSTDAHFPYRVCGAQQDSGTECVLSRSDYGEIRDNDWSPVGGFEDAMIVTDPLNDRFVYTQGWYHVFRRFDRETGQVVVLYTPTPDDRFVNIPPVAFSPQDPHLLYTAAQYVMASNDDARDWHHVSPDLTVRPEGPDTTRPSGPYARRFSPAIQAIALSPVASGEMWVGTNNGLIQLTRDGGQTWTNVSPPGVSARGSVNIMDASHHDAGTAYAAVDVLNDYHPHIYRTTDFGQTWTEIVTGITDNALVRTVREDPVDPKLLYAGTEFGAWVSFDKGDHWQSLELNLPHTVVSDMTIHDNDLAISTYGRALWVLDDVTPLRDIRSALAAPVHLYHPETAVRVRFDNIQDTPLPPEVPMGQNPPEGAMIDYALKTQAAGPVTLAVYDPQGQLVRQYSSVAPPPDTTMPNIPEYWFEKPIVLPTAPGMHRIAWDLRYVSPPALPYSYSGNLITYVEYTLNWHAVKGRMPREFPVGPMAVPGTYQVRLTVNGQTYTQDLVLENDPRISITQAGLVRQLNLEQRMSSGIATSTNVFDHLRDALAVLDEDVVRAKKQSPQPTQLLAAASAYEDSVSALAGVPRGGFAAGNRPPDDEDMDDADAPGADEMAAPEGPRGFGVANRDLVRHLEDSEIADLDPTASDLAAVDASCEMVDNSLAGLERVQSTLLPQLNAQLQAAHLAPVPAVSAPAKGC